MLICRKCQLTNPPDYKFCQRCGEPLLASPAVTVPAAEENESVDGAEMQPMSGSNQPLRARLMPPDRVGLSPAIYLDSQRRYQVLTVLSQGSALVDDKTPVVRSPLQKKLFSLSGASVSVLQNHPDLPQATYPYLLLSQAAPPLYDAWQRDDTTILIMPAEQTVQTSLIKAFSDAVDPLQYVYWMYTLTELWVTLAPIPQWRSSLLLTDNLGIDDEQSVRIWQFIPPAQAAVSVSPELSEFKSFLQSLLALPHRGAADHSRQIRKIILTVTAAETLDQLRSELAAIGESLLGMPEAMTPSAASPLDEVSLPAAFTTEPTELSTKANNSEEDIENSIGLDEINSAEPADDSTMVLPMKLLSLENVGRTDVGRQRDHNEDCFWIDSSIQKQAHNRGEYTQAHCLYVLCDGMGGHAGGEVASQLAAQTVTAYFKKHWPHPLPGSSPPPLPEETVVVEAVKLANKAIFEVNEKEGRVGHERMGTTIVIVLLQGTEACVAHVGDSRFYQHTRRLGLQQITTDHEVGQREIKRGIPADIAYARPDAYQLTQALGPRGAEGLVPSVTYLSFSEDTLLLLCSDGLSDNDLVEDYVESHIDPLLRGKKDLASGLNELIDVGNEVNGHDNISAIAIRLKISPDTVNLSPNRSSEVG